MRQLHVIWLRHLCLVEFIDQNVYHMIFRRHFYYFIVVVNVCIHVCGGGVHVIMKMNRELFYTKKVMDLYDIYLITDVEILFWPIRLFYFTYITHLFTIDNQWFLPVLRTECLFFWLLFVFRIKKISSLLFVTYNKKKMKCCVQMIYVFFFFCALTCTIGVFFPWK